MIRARHCQPSDFIRSKFFGNSFPPPPPPPRIYRFRTRFARRQIKSKYRRIHNFSRFIYFFFFLPFLSIQPPCWFSFFFFFHANPSAGTFVFPFRLPGSRRLFIYTFRTAVCRYLPLYLYIFITTRYFCGGILSYNTEATSRATICRRGPRAGSPGKSLASIQKYINDRSFVAPPPPPPPPESLSFNCFSQLAVVVVVVGGGGGARH